MNPKISIAIPIFNKIDYLSRCLYSVQNQSYHDIEIVLVDDGSTDGSSELIDKIAEDDDRIVVVHQMNGGEGAARNTAIDRSCGDYIVFVDADDTIELNLASEIIKMVQKYNSDCIIYENYIISSKDKRIGYHMDKLLSWDAGTKDFLRCYFGSDLDKLGTAVWNKAMNLSIIKNTNLRFNNQGIGADMRFCFEYAMHSNGWVRLNEPLYNYFQNEDSVMHVFSEDYEEKIKANILSVEEFAQKYELLPCMKKYVCNIQLRDGFTMCKYFAGVSDDIKTLMASMKKFTHEPFYRSRFINADIKQLTWNYKVFYILYRYHLHIALMLMILLYENRYGK